MQRAQLEGLLEVQKAITASRGTLQETFDIVVNAKSVMPQASGAVVELIDGDHLYYAAASGAAESQLGFRLPLSASLSGLSVMTGKSLHCADSDEDPRVNAAACKAIGLRSMVIVPIPYRGHILGALKFFSAEPNQFSPEDMQIAALLIGPIAISLSRLSETAAQSMQDQLRKVIRIKQEFVSTVSHELRTPLTAIIGALTLLEKAPSPAGDSQAQSLVAMARRNADRLKLLVDDLLDIHALDEGRMAFDVKRVDAREIVADVHHDLYGFADRVGVQLVIEQPDDPLLIDADPHRLSQALANLVSNAAKFSPSGSTVRLALKAETGSVVFRVEDKGPGVPEKFRSRLFERFAQAEHNRQLTNLPGTGLGLAITRAIMEEMGGEVRLDEDFAPGAAFELVLPLP